MKALTVIPEQFNCPNCGEIFPGHDLVELCNEPFNGTIARCVSCKKEWSCDLLIRITEV